MSGFCSTVSAQCNFTQGPIGELCTSAYYICGSELDGYTSRLPDKASVNQLWTGLCNGNGNADNIIWFTFTPCTNKVTLEITVTNCTIVAGNTGVQVGLFGGCNKDLFLDCSKSPSPPSLGLTGTFTVSSDQFVPGQNGFLYIDGYGYSVCDFTIKVIEGIDTTPVTAPDPTLLADGFITGPNVLECNEANDIKMYSLTLPECQVNVNAACGNSPVNPSDSVCFVWQISPSSGRYFVNQDSVGKFNNIVFTEPGTYTISAQGFFHPFYGGSCANAACGKINTWVVNVKGPDTLINTPIYICPGNSFSFCGTNVTSDTIIYCSIDRCNVTAQEFKVGTSKLNLMGTQYICNGSYFEFQGKKYFSNGSFEVLDINDCSLLHRFRVEVITVDVKVLDGARLLDCNTTNITLEADGTTNGTLPLSYSWINESGTIISTDRMLNISIPGKYIVETNYTIAGQPCKAIDAVTITQDIKKPSVNAFIPTQKCKKSGESPSVLTLISNDALTLTEWTNPLGIKSNGMNIITDSINVIKGKPYKFLAVGINGCKLDTSFIVPSNFQKAIVDLTGDNITCYFPKPLMTAKVNIPIDEIRWQRILPGVAFLGSSPNILTLNSDGAGRYECKVMASSSHCWSADSLDIADKIAFPIVDAGNNLKWHCNTTRVQINPIVSLGNNFLYQWSTDNGVFEGAGASADIMAKALGTYKIIVTDIENGCKSRDSISISNETNVPESIQFVSEDVHCFGETNGLIEILGASGGFGPYKFMLDGVELTSNEIGNLPPAQYMLEVRDKYDCAYQINININEPELMEISTPTEYSISFSDVLGLDFDSNYPDDQISLIKWNNSKGEILGTDFTLNFSSDYSDIVDLEVVTDKGCMARTKIYINVDNKLQFYFPNVFSPNGDNINDRFVIWKNKIPANIDKLSIFDRLGNKVYEQSNFEFEDNPLGWDGNFNGRAVEVGVYVYVVEYTDFSGQKKIIKKDLTLLR
ncbi:MAG: gliding motility-associated C-terminal domain-containing protein [Saprospiraceae bacterium]|nr:gliding motility-associated C-terminal domain-containing protein [Saprospiraceae bacterium]